MPIDNRTLTISQIWWLGNEVERQKAPPTQVVCMGEAFLYMQKIDTTFNADDVRKLNSLTLGLGRDARYRETPVTFADGGSSCHPQSVPYAMSQLLNNIPDRVELRESLMFEEDIDAWIKQFLWIHPFEDGNGRVAAILFNWLWDSFESPISFRRFDF